MHERWVFRLLGPLEVRCDGIAIPVTAAKQRVLIAVLTLAAGEPVPVERLITCLWGDRTPHSARNTLQNYVLRLRRVLRVDAEPSPLVSSAAGYRLAVPADAVDVHRFRSAVSSAQSTALTGQPESAAMLLDEALALWRGEPLADVPSDVLRREVAPGLVEQRLAALEQRIDLDLDRGCHAGRITELMAMTTEHPLRERMWAQLMLALDRSGRTAEALDAYRRASRILGEELGINPGPELQRLHQAVLTNRPTGPAPEPTRQLRPAPRVVPRQLPPPSAHFVGRAREVRHLGAQVTALSGSPLMVITAIVGTAGIGKTALALHWGHLHADQFPDGQLYVNLRGFDPAGDPLSPMTALFRFLTALGVPEQSVPADPDEQIALYRTQLARRRMLIVLDNARDTNQVRPLLPGAPGCLVLVTSRDQLTSLVALDGAVPLTLDLLSQDEARDLLIRRLGRDRVAREQTAVDELIHRCARLPLALNIAAAHAALQPNRPLAAFVTDLRDTGHPLDALTTGDATADVRAVFSWSYRTLTPTTARVFRLIGLHPGPDVSLLTTASLVGHDLDTTRHALAELTRAHLITEHSPGRHVLHDLLRVYTAELVRLHDTDAEQQAALRRVVDLYAQTGYSAGRLLTPHRTPIRLEPASGAQPQPLADASAALVWLDAEYAGLMAAQQVAVTHAWHGLVWQIAWSLNTYQVRRGHRHDHVVVWQAALDATAHLTDPRAAMFAHRRLGSALADLGRHGEAIAYLHRALALAEEHHDIDQQFETHRVLGWAWRSQDNYPRALEHGTRLVDLSRTLGEPAREAAALNQRGYYLAQLGDFDAARTHCEAALAIQRSLDGVAGDAATLDSLGYIAHHSGRHRQAVEYYQEALSRYRDRGHDVLVSEIHEKLGDAHAALGEHEQARAQWRKALELFRQQGRDQDADRVQRQLDH
ncbi:AfsR/SARP family transcriptional regulator [Kutzneria sp. CA-103260]|uniref:AfsR/SARP family transcriptional regulator n=1 Tax=Kutzneria sp. CA-103260 TaxID=2802641 RepID=UPI001BA5D452|nr:BTAD domain-containing putative transcriptional regulator [Kutzneria sp. CA-103260]